MGETVIGLLHPGEMGAAVAGCLTGRGYQVLWVPAGRGPATRARAAAAGLTAAGPGCRGRRELAPRAGFILSICPPHAALEVARAVAAGGFPGIFVDANAISPGTAGQVRAVVEAGRGPLRGRRDHRAAAPGPGGAARGHPAVPGRPAAAGDGDGPAGR